MDKIIQFISAHALASHTIVMALAFGAAKYFFPTILKDEQALVLKALALQRAKLKALGATPDQIKELDDKEAKILQGALDAVKADESAQ